MKRKKSLLIFAFVIFTIVIAIVMGIVKHNKDISPQTASARVDYSAFTISIAEDHLKNTPALGYAVVYGEKGDVLELMTAAHIFKKKKDKYTAMFYSGKCFNIKKVRIPIDDLDLAFFEIDRQNLQNGKDYAVPRFSRYNADKVNSNLYIFMDELYNPSDRKILDWKSNEKKVSQLFIPGKIEKGRSGSPVFLKNTDICIGVVSGYIFGKDDEGDKTLAFLLY